MEDITPLIYNLRKNYSMKTLDEQDVAPSPVIQFEQWFKEVIDTKVPEPNAMTLATASSDGKPSARIVLLRRFDEKGCVFYTNYKSRKGEEISKNSYGALVFFWPELQRQVRIEGHLTKQNSEESDSYFDSRPRESQLGAWVSEQSKIIANRKLLDDKFKSLSDKYGKGVIPRPPYWGGFILNPDSVEFWQGRPGRLHDRILYTLENESWKIQRLAP